MSNFEESDFSADDWQVLQSLLQLESSLDALTLKKYKRINPFMENVVDWNAKACRQGSQCSTVYDSATLIGDIHFGNHVWVGPFCILDGGSGLTIGDYCVFASGVQIYTHDTAKWALSGGKCPYEYSAVTIGNCVFIGAQSIITRGVTVGDHALICANATITRDVPSYAIMAGTPGRRIGTVKIDGDGQVELCYE